MSTRLLVVATLAAALLFAAAPAQATSAGACAFGICPGVIVNMSPTPHGWVCPGAAVGCQPFSAPPLPVPLNPIGSPVGCVTVTNVNGVPLPGAGVVQACP
jgi:hypothetical protein